MKFLKWIRNTWTAFITGFRARPGADAGSNGDSDDGPQSTGSNGDSDDGPQSSGAAVPRVPVTPQRSGAGENLIPEPDQEPIQRGL